MAVTPVIPFAPALTTRAGLRAALPVEGASQWRRFAMTAAYLAGHGGALVVGCGAESVAAGAINNHRFWIRPRAHTLCRLWTFTLATPNGPPLGGIYNGTIFVNSVQIGSWSIARSGSFEYVHATFRMLETVASPSSTPQEARFEIRNSSTSSGAVRLVALGCSPVPRLLQSTYNGSLYVPGEQRLKAGSPIADITGAEGASTEDMAVAASGVGGLLANASRSKLYDWSSEAGVVVTAGTFPGSNNVVRASPAVMGRLLYSGETVRTVAVSVYAKVTGGALTGEVKFTAASGGTVTMNVTSATAAWVHGTLDIECDDMSRLSIDGGIRGGTRDTVTIEARKTGTTTSITVHGLAIAESG